MRGKLQPETTSPIPSGESQLHAISEMRLGRILDSLIVLRSDAKTIWAAVFLTALIGFLDWRLPDAIPLSFLHLFPMAMFGRVLTVRQIPFGAALCTFITELVDPFSWNAKTGIARDFLYFLSFLAIGLFVRQIVQSRRLLLDRLREVEAQTKARFEAEQQLEALVQNSPAAIVTTDADGRILMANDAAHRLLGVKEPSLLGRLLQTYFPSLRHLTDRETSRRLFRTMMQSRGRREDGDTFLAEICFSTYKTSSGSRLAAMILDSSEDFRSREEASLQQMLAGSRIAVNAVSHEIRNVCGAIAAVHKNFACNPRFAADTDFESLGNLVTALERIASVELRPYLEQASEVDLAVVLENLRIVISPSLEDNSIDLVTEIDPSLPLIWADEGNLMQVFLNLTTNSVRALSETEHVRSLSIRARQEKARVVVEVEDTGGGIADTTQLFRPFQPGAKNTGLGLYLARAFARSFGGDLQFEPTTNGSRFVVELASVQAMRSQTV